MESTASRATDAAEDAALAELARRAGRLRLVVFVPIVLAGVGAIVPAYWGATLLQWELLGVAWTAASAVAGAAPLLLGVALGRVAARAILRARVPSLATALARRHGLAEDALEDLALVLTA